MALVAVLLAALPLSLLAQNVGILPFSYAASAGGTGGGCFPNSNGLSVTKNPSLTIGSTAYLCININGVVTSMYNLVVDQYSAISVSGSACAPAIVPLFPFASKVKEIVVPLTLLSPHAAPPPHAQQATTPPRRTRATLSRARVGCPPWS